MRIWERTFLPTGEMFVDEDFDTSDIHHDSLSEHDTWWRANQSLAETVLDTPIGPLNAKFTFTGEGPGLGTYTLSDTPVLSSVLLGGLNEGADSELLGMFLESMRKVKHVKLLAKEELPFESLRALRHRPAVGAVFWPIIPLDQFEHLVPRLMLFEASFFRTRSQTGS